MIVEIALDHVVIDELLETHRERGRTKLQDLRDELVDHRACQAQEQVQEYEPDRDIEKCIEAHGRPPLHASQMEQPQI